MKPAWALFLAGLVAGLASAAFVWFVRMPLPFAGFSVVAAAGLAFLGTLSLATLMPQRWIWSEAELLRNAFRARHGLTDYSAGSALEAITTAHARAGALRKSADVMREDVFDRVASIADRLDAAAREIFYEPDRHRDLRAILIRSELIEDAAQAHAALRRRNSRQTDKMSRGKLIDALDALDAAFDETELRAARGLLTEVTSASEVAETLLKPRGATRARNT